MSTLLIHLLLPRRQIRKLRINKLRPLHNLPKHKHKPRKRNPKVTRHKALHIERLQRIPAREQNNHTPSPNREIREERHERCFPWERIARDALCFEGAVPADEGDEVAGVGENEADGGEVHEPAKYNDGTGGRDEE